MRLEKFNVFYSWGKPRAYYCKERFEIGNWCTDRAQIVTDLEGKILYKTIHL